MSAAVKPINNSKSEVIERSLLNGYVLVRSFKALPLEEEIKLESDFSYGTPGKNAEEVAEDETAAGRKLAIVSDTDTSDKQAKDKDSTSIDEDDDDLDELEAAQKAIREIRERKENAKARQEAEEASAEKASKKVKSASENDHDDEIEAKNKHLEDSEDSSAGLDSDKFSKDKKRKSASASDEDEEEVAKSDNDGVLGEYSRRKKANDAAEKEGDEDQVEEGQDIHAKGSEQEAEIEADIKKASEVARAEKEKKAKAEAETLKAREKSAKDKKNVQEHEEVLNREKNLYSSPLKQRSEESHVGHEVYSQSGAVSGEQISPVGEVQASRMKPEVAVPSMVEARHARNISQQMAREQQDSANERFTFGSIFGLRKSKRNTEVANTVARSKPSASIAGEDQNYFFRAVDDEMLYRLGDSFYKDFQNGIKHFGFANINASESQKRTVLGVASFINYFDDASILIVTHDMGSGVYAQFKTDRHTRRGLIGNSEHAYNYYHASNINFIEISELEALKKSLGSRSRSFPALVKKLVGDYSAVLFDLPSLSAREEQYAIYLPLLQLIDNVTFTVSLKNNRFSEINQLQRYFNSYKISIKGSVIEKNNSREKYGRK